MGGGEQGGEALLLRPAVGGGDRGAEHALRLHRLGEFKERLWRAVIRGLRPRRAIAGRAGRQGLAALDPVQQRDQTLLDQPVRGAANPVGGGAEAGAQGLVDLQPKRRRTHGTLRVAPSGKASLAKVQPTDKATW